MSAGAGPAAALCALTPEGAGGVGDLGRGRRAEGGLGGSAEPARAQEGRAGGWAGGGIGAVAKRMRER